MIVWREEKAKFVKNDFILSLIIVGFVFVYLFKVFINKIYLLVLVLDLFFSVV